nr:MAG TPA: hypothetical protein [Caudoviricetes sp.]
MEFFIKTLVRNPIRFKLRESNLLTYKELAKN